MNNYSETTRGKAQEAGDIIRERGWCQGKRGHLGAVCAREAMEIVCVKHHPELGPMVDGLVDLSNAFRAEIGSSSIIAWNDTKGRTKEEVLVILNHIANQ